ncbi:MAG: MaoC family dehydratase [Rhodospirillales bacterium]|jgi:acyl dehydratase|nr:MaoC family dehydratase [Rhodospirillales bacterium]
MTQTLRFNDLNVGDSLPNLAKPAISRLQLALFAGASGDHNPIHVDEEAAKAGGLPGCIAHGMLTMAFLGQLLTDVVPSHRIRSFSGRFTSMAFPGDSITCQGKVAAKTEEAGEKIVMLELAALNQKGEVLMAGTASLALD